MQVNQEDAKHFKTLQSKPLFNLKRQAKLRLATKVSALRLIGAR